MNAGWCNKWGMVRGSGNLRPAPSTGAEIWWVQMIMVALKTGMERGLSDEGLVHDSGAMPEVYTSCVRNYLKNA